MPTGRPAWQGCVWLSEPLPHGQRRGGDSHRPGGALSGFPVSGSPYPELGGVLVYKAWCRGRMHSPGHISQGTFRPLDRSS